METKEFNEILNLIKSPDPEVKSLGMEMFKLSEFYKFLELHNYELPKRGILKPCNLMLSFTGLEFDLEKLALMFNDWKLNKFDFNSYDINTISYVIKDQNGKYIDI